MDADRWWIVHGERAVCHYTLYTCIVTRPYIYIYILHNTYICIFILPDYELVLLDPFQVQTRIHKTANKDKIKNYSRDFIFQLSMMSHFVLREQCLYITGMHICMTLKKLILSKKYTNKRYTKFCFYVLLHTCPVHHEMFFVSLYILRKPSDHIDDCQYGGITVTVASRLRANRGI